MSKQQQQKYKIPKNLCQQCYQTSGRFILDCYCIICQDCYSKHHTKQSSLCNLCGRATKGNKIDAKQEASMKKIGHLFQNIDIGMQRMLEIHKFQSQITNRYCQYLEKQLLSYQNAINQIVTINPGLYSFFNSRVRLKKQQNTNYHHENRSTIIKPDPTIKATRQYGSEILESRRTTLELNPPASRMNTNINGDYSAIRPIGKNAQNNNLSGNVIYKVPNINYNTAVRSSKRVIKGYDKIAPEYDDDDYYRKRRQ